MDARQRGIGDTPPPGSQRLIAVTNNESDLNEEGSQIEFRAMETHTSADPTAQFPVSLYWKSRNRRQVCSWTAIERETTALYYRTLKVKTVGPKVRAYSPGSSGISDESLKDESPNFEIFTGRPGLGV